MHKRPMHPQERVPNRRRVNRTHATLANQPVLALPFFSSSALGDALLPRPGAPAFHPFSLGNPFHGPVACRP